MLFLIDGYNFLFRMEDSRRSLQVKRNAVVEWVQTQFQQLGLKGLIVFDGSHRRDEESGLSYPSPMEVAFTPKGQSADAYIVEQIGLVKNKKSCIVVTDDRGLSLHARACGAQTQSNSSFLQWLKKKREGKRGRGRVLKETPHQIERLTKIFEERLERDEE